MTSSSTSSARPQRNPLVLLGLLFGVTLAPLLAYSDLPSPSVYNNLVTLFGFGLLLIGLSVGRALEAGWRVDGVSVALVVLLLATLTAPFIGDAPGSVALGYGAVLLATLLVIQTARAVRPALLEDILTLFSLAVLAAALLSTVVGAIQLFAPDWPDNVIIAFSNGEGRAVGNMRQPNQLASLLLWGCVAAVWLAQGGWLQRRLGNQQRATLALWALLLVLVLGVLFSASRTGAVGVLLLAIWALVDAVLARFGKARLLRGYRIALALTPVMWAIGWPIVSWLTQLQGQGFFAESRMSTQGASSPERMLIIRDTWTLVKDYPWTGTGWGDFNLAWTLTPFPDRYAAVVDHSHNIFLQLVAELGWPLGGLVSVLVLAGVGQALWRGFAERSGAGACAAMILLVIGWHSQTEFPLWYVYFLLPAAFAYGLSLVRKTRKDTAPAESAPRMEAKAEEILQRRDLGLAGVLMVVLAPLAGKSYQDAVNLYDPRPGAPALVERIAQAQGSMLFDYYADYVIATMLPPGKLALGAAQRTAHHIIDARLLIAWSRSLHAVGQTDKARYVADRLREFHHRLGDEFFAECAKAEAPGTERPFQCDPASKVYDFRDFR